MNTPSTQTQAVAARVNTMLRGAGISQRDAHLALDSDISFATFSRRLTGKSPFRVDELEAIADLLGVPFLALVSEERAA